MSKPFPVDLMAALVTFQVEAENFTTAVKQRRWLDALKTAGELPHPWTDAVAAVAQLAYNEGATKREMADALQVPAAYFRGITRETEREES